MPVDTAARVYRRYLQLEPGHVEEYIAYCRSGGEGGAGGVEESIA